MGVYEWAAAKCPKELSEAPTAVSIPPAAKKAIEKFACDFVAKRFPEQGVAKDMCEDLKKKVKFLPEAPCEAVIDKIYDWAAAKCPKELSEAPTAVSIPSAAKKAIEKFAC